MPKEHGPFLKLFIIILTIRDLMFIWNRLIMLILGVSPHQDDVTTRAVRVALQPALETWKELGPSGRHHLAGLVVFHCALWRTFGTKEFIRKLGFLESLETWKEESWQQVVDVALSCWERGELCFTEAYCPSRLWRKWEVGAFRDPKGKERVGSLFQDLFFLFFQFFLRIALSISLSLTLSLSLIFQIRHLHHRNKICQGKICIFSQEVCRSQLRGIWEHRFDIVRVAESGCSWRQVVQAIMAVPHYGGTGTIFCINCPQDFFHPKIMNMRKRRWTPIIGPEKNRHFH